MSSLYSEFRQSAIRHARRPALTWKQNRKWHTRHYATLLLEVDQLAVGLAKTGVKKGVQVAIFSENRPEWLISDLAINSLGAITVPVHASANAEFLGYVLKDSESSFLIVSSELYRKFEEYISNLGITVIALEDKRSEADGRKENAKILYYLDLISKDIKSRERVEVLGDDVATIIYTSGTTGNPKGVMLSNDNLLSNIAATLKAVPVYKQDRFLSFLPLSHILERALGSYIPVLCGANIAYAENVKVLGDNFREIKPTVIISVPRIFEKSYEKIFLQIRSGWKIIRDFFFWSLRQQKGSWGKKIADKLVYTKIRRALGGKLRFAISGGASINPSIIRFFDNIGIAILEGYGLTETSPIICGNSFTDRRFGTVGRPFDGIEIKIGNDKEILAKGANVMKGYYHKEDMTKQAIDSEGWFHTGDLGFMDSDGFVTIVGRKSDMIVTSNGKNVSPEKIENMLNLCPHISQALVFGHKQAHLSALITVEPRERGEDENGEPFDITKAVKKDMDEVNEKLMPHERIHKFKILDNQFTIEAGELTPTLKLRRKVIEQKYGEEIKKMMIK